MRHMTASAEVTSHVRLCVHVMQERLKLFYKHLRQISVSPLCLEGMLGISPKWHRGRWDREQHKLAREPFH